MTRLGFSGGCAGTWFWIEGSARPSQGVCLGRKIYWHAAVDSAGSFSFVFQLADLSKAEPALSGWVVKVAEVLE